MRQKREELGVPNPAGNRWRPEHVALLGTLPDEEVARTVGRSFTAVTQKRIKLGIANPFDGAGGTGCERRNRPRLIGRVPFVDGVTRDVHENPDGREWVTGYESETFSGGGRPSRRRSGR